jgi:hypothetical protein
MPEVCMVSEVGRGWNGERERRFEVVYERRKRRWKLMRMMDVQRHTTDDHALMMWNSVMDCNVDIFSSTCYHRHQSQS